MKNIEKSKAQISKLIQELSRKLPKFSDGRIDYTNSKIAPVITIFVKHKGKILLLKRSDKVLEYKNLWNTVSGYLDELKPIEEKAKEELKEEVGIEGKDISEIKLGEIYKFTDRTIQKTWVILPILVQLNEKPKIKLDWEHSEYKWIAPEDLKKYAIVPKLQKSWQNLQES